MTGSLWVLQEALRDRTPFGGFPWGRLAFSQGDSPLLGLAALGGAPLVTFGVAAARWAGRCSRSAPCGAVGTVALGRPGRPARWPRCSRRGLVLLVAPLPLPHARHRAGHRCGSRSCRATCPGSASTSTPSAGRCWTTTSTRRSSWPRDVAAGTAAQPDLVVWPENASDIDPLRNPDARRRIDEAAARDRRTDPGRRPAARARARRTSATSASSGSPAVGPTQTLRQAAPGAVRRVHADPVVRPHDHRQGRPGPVGLRGRRRRRACCRSARRTVGDVICFEVAYDEVVRDTVTGGAQLLVVQTNNATFNEAEARQQLAMVRLRAVEHGRPALMASTVGVSAFVDEAGNVYDATAFNAPARHQPGRHARHDAVPWQPDSVPSPSWRWPWPQSVPSSPPSSSGGPGVRGARNGRMIVERGLPRRRSRTGDHPDLQRGRQRPDHHRPAAPRGAGGRRPGRRRQQPRRHRGDRRRAGRRRPARSTCCTGPARQGLGAAYLAGFAWARDRGYDAVVEMDADGSHAPEELPQLLDALADADVVLGSRWVRGGKVRQLAAAPAT